MIDFDKAPKWSDKFVLDYFIACMLEDNGTPRFMVKIFGTPLPDHDVLLVCRDFDNQDLLASIPLKDVPEPIMKIIEQTGHRDLAEWKKVLAAIAPKDVLEKIVKIAPRFFRPVDLERMEAYRLYFEQQGVKPLNKETALRIIEKYVNQSKK